jgi:hypothetical protein
MVRSRAIGVAGRILLVRLARDEKPAGFSCPLVLSLSEGEGENMC